MPHSERHRTRVYRLGPVLPSSILRHYQMKLCRRGPTAARKLAHVWTTLSCVPIALGSSSTQQSTEQFICFAISLPYWSHAPLNRCCLILEGSCWQSTVPYSIYSAQPSAVIVEGFLHPPVSGCTPTPWLLGEGVKRCLGTKKIWDEMDLC